MAKVLRQLARLLGAGAIAFSTGIVGVPAVAGFDGSEVEPSPDATATDSSGEREHLPPGLIVAAGVSSAEWAATFPTDRDAADASEPPTGGEPTEQTSEPAPTTDVPSSAAPQPADDPAEPAEDGDPASAEGDPAPADEELTDVAASSTTADATGLTDGAPSDEPVPSNPASSALSSVADPAPDSTDAASVSPTDDGAVTVGRANPASLAALELPGEVTTGPGVTRLERQAPPPGSPASPDVSQPAEEEPAPAIGTEEKSCSLRADDPQEHGSWHFEARHSELLRSIRRSGPESGLIGAEAALPLSSAGIALAGPRASSVVSVAMDFARLSGGWAGPLAFNVWLRRLMRERRLSQRQLGMLSGVSHSTISRLLADRRSPKLETATKIVHALRMNWTDEQVATYFDFLPEQTLFPTQRVESALRGDGSLEDHDVRAVMDHYLVLRAQRRRERERPGAGVQQAQPSRARQDQPAGGP
jgi:transcriptional regulator with XRE-family HTH domain